MGVVTSRTLKHHRAAAPSLVLPVRVDQIAVVGFNRAFVEA